MSGRRAATLQKREPDPPDTPKTDIERAKCLSKEELSRKSLSYVATCVAAIFLGLIILPGFSSAVIPLSEDARSGGFFLDFFFLVVIPLLTINSMSLNYMFIHRNPFHSWVLFQRSLPVSPKEIVLARAIVMLPATVVVTALFFAPLTILAGALDYQFDAIQYLWFILIWLGYALFSGGINLYMELGLNGKLVLALQFLWAILLIIVIWLLKGEIVFMTFELAGSRGPLPAGVSLFVGGGLFALLAKATERRVGEREMST